MAHLNLAWLFLAVSVCCIAIVGRHFGMARWVGLASSCCGIGWAVMNNDYGLVPFNVILLAIAALETRRNMKMAAQILHLENPPAKKAKPVAKAAPRKKAA